MDPNWFWKPTQEPRSKKLLRTCCGGVFLLGLSANSVTCWLSRLEGYHPLISSPKWVGLPLTDLAEHPSTRHGSRCPTLRLLVATLFNASEPNSIGIAGMAGDWVGAVCVCVCVCLNLAIHISIDSYLPTYLSIYLSI